MEKEEITLPRYDGTTDVERWLTIVDNAAKIKHWEPGMILSQALLHLSDSALSWSENSGATAVESYDQLKKQMKLRFKVTLNDAALRVELSKVKRKRDESIYTFADRLQAVTKKAAEKLSDSAVIQYFIKGLPHEFQFPLFIHVQATPLISFAEVVKLVNDFESLGITERDNTSNMPSSSSPINYADQKQKDRCHYCHKLGHTESECRKKKSDDSRQVTTQVVSHTPDEKLRSDGRSVSKHCSYCNRDGHDVEHCYKRLNNEGKRNKINVISDSVQQQPDSFNSSNQN